MKYLFLFLLLGGMTSYLGVSLGGYAHLLHWLSLSFIALAVGYGGFGPGVFGKRKNGQIPLWAKVIHLPYMIYTQAVWKLTLLFNHENPTDKVCNELVLGRRLHASEIPDGIANWVDLTFEMEDPVEIRQFSNYICMPVLDAGVPKVQELEMVFSRLTPGITYVHCAQGHGRTGLFALALLAKHGRIHSYQEGMELIKRTRPGIKLNKKQEIFIKNFITEQNAHTS